MSYSSKGIGGSPQVSGKEYIKTASSEHLLWGLVVDNLLNWFGCLRLLLIGETTICYD